MITLFHAAYYIFSEVLKFSCYLCKTAGTENHKNEEAQPISNDQTKLEQNTSFSGQTKYLPTSSDHLDFYSSKLGAYVEEDGIRFYPPVYAQRYDAVRKQLERDEFKNKIKKVVDFGCAECGFFTYAKHLTGLEEILLVDIDKSLLESYSCRAAPLNSDYLNLRASPLNVKVYAGSVAERDPILLGCEAVVCIELIEHLYPDDLEELPYTIFGYIKPAIAIFTTPNFEFNVHFSHNRFRHPDHKFEWTREQFNCWAINLTQRYSDYEVAFHDIGKGPPGTEKSGGCSQMAVFVNTHFDDIGSSSILMKDVVGYSEYELVKEYIYPFKIDNRTPEEKLKDEIVYHMNKLESYDEEDDDGIPLTSLDFLMNEFCCSLDNIRCVLEQEGWTVIEDDFGESWIKRNNLYSSESSSASSDADIYDDQHCWNGEGGTEYCTYDDEQCWNVENASECWNGFNNIVSAEDNILKNTMETNVFEEMPLSKCCMESAANGTEPKREVLENEFMLTDKLDQHIAFNFIDNTEKTGKEKQKENSFCEADKVGGENLSASESALFSEGAYSFLRFEKCVNNSAESNSFSESSKLYKACSFTGNLDERKNIPFLDDESSKCRPLYRRTQSSDTVLPKSHISSEFSKRLSYSPAQSFSLDEQNDFAGDSGYPNSSSVQDMDMDLTPEQVDEILTENDVLTEDSSLNNNNSYSLSDLSEDENFNEEHVFNNFHHNDVVFEEALNVENGDVANNNRDGEGNNVVPIQFGRDQNVNRENLVEVGENEDEGLDNDFLPLLAAAEDFDNDNDQEVPEDAPFPHWLLQLVDLVDPFVHDSVLWERELVNDCSSSDDDDAKNDKLPSLKCEGTEENTSRTTSQQNL